MGVPVENRERIFDPFFTTRAPGEGTGLGLYLSRQIIEAHGGSLRVGSVHGRGAAFIINYRSLAPLRPRAPPSGSGGMKSPKPAQSGERRAVVLYVDDDRANLLAFRAIAEPTYEVVVARSGDEALALISQNPRTSLC